MDNLTSSGLLIGTILLLLVLIGLGVPVAFAIGLVAAVGVVVFLSPAHLAEMGSIAFQNSTNFVFVAVPLFIFMAEVLTATKFSSLLFDAASKWLNRVPGALAISSIAACSGFAAICGSSAATAATVGGPAVPEMMRHGYDKRLSVGAAASGGTLGILIPPSIAMIIFGIINEVSIGQLYIAGIIPGLMMALLLSLAIAVAVRARPQLAPPIGPVSWSERGAALGRIWPFIVLVIAMIVPIYTGLATPTESAAIGAAGALAYGAATKTLTRQLLGHALMRTVQTTAMSMFLLIGGFMLAFVLSSLRIPQTISRLIVSMEIAPWMVIVAISLLFLILGFCLDPTSELVLMSPVVFPVVVELGYDPIWFGIIMTINTEIANIMPPDGINLLVLRSVVPEGISMDDIILGSIPFVLVLLLGMGVLMVFPEIALWLPRQMK